MRYKGGCAVMLRLPVIQATDRLMRVMDATTWLGTPDWRPTEVQDYHLTLQFIGRDLPADKIAAVIVSAFTFADEQRPGVTLEMTGKFDLHSTKKGRYIVAGVRADAGLLAARERLQKALDAMGVKPQDSFAFKPHVTIAEAPPSAKLDSLPTAISPFSLECRELIVKYGPHRMTVELGD